MVSVSREIEGGEVKAKYEETGVGPERTASQDDTETAQRAITAPKKKRRKWTKTKTSVPEDVTPETSPSESQQPATERTEPESPDEENSVISEAVEAAGQQQTAVELSPFRTKAKKKERKDGPKRSADSTEISHRKYYRPATDAKTYRMNGIAPVPARPQQRDQCEQYQGVASLKREANIP